MKFLRMLYHPDPGLTCKNRRSHELRGAFMRRRLIAATVSASEERASRCPRGIALHRAFSPLESIGTTEKTFPDKRKPVLIHPLILFGILPPYFH